jgi:AraC-like DNA-binding protein
LSTDWYFNQVINNCLCQNYSKQDGVGTTMLNSNVLVRQGASWGGTVPALFRRRCVWDAAEALPDESAGGTLDFADVGQLKIGHFTAHRSCVVRHPFALSGDAPDYVMMVVQLRGHCVFEQSGRSMQLLAGNWGLCDAPRPCLSHHAPGSEQLHLLIPRDRIRLGIDPRFAIGRTFTGASRVAALMCQTIATLFEDLPNLGARQAEELCDIALRLFHIAVHERIAQPDCSSPHEDMRERIRNLVESRLRDPRLSLDQIATDLNCTKRYLHMVFAGEAQTLNQYIWARRLEHSRQELENPLLRNLTITQIALAWGFSNVSHFSRAFRERYDCAPREARDGRSPVCKPASLSEK